nr:MAG TPA: repressor [Caudoviricetes sp.]
MGGKTSCSSRDKYNKKTYDRINLMIRKDSPINKDYIAKEAQRKGKSLTGYILDAVWDYIEREKQLENFPTCPESNLEPPKVFDENGLRYELNYHEMCCLFYKALRDDPNLTEGMRKSLIGTICRMHDTLIDVSW